MNLFGPSSSADGNGDAPAALPPHKDPNQVAPVAAKAAAHGGPRPGAGRKPAAPGEPRAVAPVPSKEKFKCTPEIARPLAALPFEVAAVLTGSDSWLLETDEEDRHALRLSDAVNDLGVEIAHAAVYAYVTMLGVTVMDKLRDYRKERTPKAPPPEPAAKTETNARTPA